MGWAVGYDSNWKRDIGYGVPAYCDHPKCSEEINRGLGYVCGGMPYGGDVGCGLYFCETHLCYSNKAEAVLCARCRIAARTGKYNPFDAKPDHPKWVHHKATDPSWADWRAEQTGAVPSPPSERDSATDAHTSATKIENKGL